MGHAGSAAHRARTELRSNGHLVTSGGNLLFLFSRAVAMRPLLPSGQPQDIRKYQKLRDPLQQVLLFAQLVCACPLNKRVIDKPPEQLKNGRA